MNGIVIKNNEFVISPVLDSQGKILTGMAVDNIDYDRVDRIINTTKGELKLHPISGFGIYNYVKSQAQDKKIVFKSELTKELKADGFINPAVITTNDLLNFSLEV